MKERPILFSGEMVRAILEGRKTQTRRVAKEPIYVDLLQVVRSDIPIPHEHIFARPGRYRAFLNDLGAASVRSEHPRGLLGVKPGEFEWVNPYGQAGDRLWVRETLKRGELLGTITYAATPNLQCTDPNAPDNLDGWSLWRFKRPVVPGIHMPRWASRITLEIVKVRVERLQQITRQDVLAEGGPPSHISIDAVSQEYGYIDWPRSWYAQLWDHLNAKRGFGWDQNPWVCVIEFRRV